MPPHVLIFSNAQRYGGIDLIKDGRPYTNENGWTDDGLLTDRPKEEQETALRWILENIKPRKTVLRERTSYGIKHILQRDCNLYLTNNQFKDAMLLSGYEPTDPNELNWHYCISAKSPAFDYRRQGR